MNTPENVSNSGKVDNLLNNVSSVTFAVSEIQDPISTSNINVTAATEKSFPQFVHYSSNFVHTSRPVNTSPMSTYQSQLYGNYVPSYNSNQINMYPYRAPVMPNTISSGLQLNCQLLISLFVLRRCKVILMLMLSSSIQMSLILSMLIMVSLKFKLVPLLIIIKLKIVPISLKLVILTVSMCLKII